MPPNMRPRITARPGYPSSPGLRRAIAQRRRGTRDRDRGRTAHGRPLSLIVGPRKVRGTSKFVDQRARPHHPTHDHRTDPQPRSPTPRTRQATTETETTSINRNLTVQPVQPVVVVVLGRVPRVAHEKSLSITGGLRSASRPAKAMRSRSPWRCRWRNWSCTNRLCGKRLSSGTRGEGVSRASDLRWSRAAVAARGDARLRGRVDLCRAHVGGGTVADRRPVRSNRPRIWAPCRACR